MIRLVSDLDESTMRARHVLGFGLIDGAPILWNEKDLSSQIGNIPFVICLFVFFFLKLLIIFILASKLLYP